MTQLAPRVPSIKESKPGAVLANLPGSLPRTTIARDVDHAAIAVSCIDNLKSLTLDTLADDAVWRDLWALTGTARTFYRPECMLPAWSELSISQRPKEFSLVPQSSKVVQLGEDFCWIQAGFVFECEGPPATTCSGIIGIVPDGHSGWKIWMLSTILEQLHGNLNPDVMPSMSEVHAAETNNSEEINFGCVIVGAGFSGLCVAGCLQAVGVRTITLEQNSCIGKNWLNRYHSARYHTSKYFSDFPHGGIFDDEYPYFLGIKDLACGYQEYVDRHKISVWLSSTVESAEYDAATTVWTLRLNRAGQKEVVKTSHVVIATGLGGNVPKMPQYRNRDLYKGTVLHSIDYKSARQWAGSSGIVVGAANTAHDIAEDMLEAKFKSVTMVQRGPTAIFPIEHYKSWSDRLYNDKVEIAKSDRETVGMPLVALRHMAMYMSRKNVDRDHQQFDNLERSGFKVERYGDLWQILTGSVSGHYMDVGGSAKIAAGLIKVKADAEPISYIGSGLKFSDGSEVTADVIIFCTGFEKSLRDNAGGIFGPKVGGTLEELWGLDDEGELRGMYKPQNYHGLWFTGGGVNHARFFSRFVALQIQADTNGTPLRVYGKRFYSTRSMPKG